MLIDYKKVDIYHKEGAPVLHDVDFHVDEGEFIYIIGRVGSGKSSLLKTIYFEMDIESAETAIVLNHDLRELKQKYIPALRRQMGIIFQDFQLLGDRTVYENLKFVLKATGWKDKAEIDERIHDVLEDVEMADFIDRYPHELSGGEQQRIAIARAISSNCYAKLRRRERPSLSPPTTSRCSASILALSIAAMTVVWRISRRPTIRWHSMKMRRLQSRQP